MIRWGIESGRDVGKGQSLGKVKGNRRIDEGVDRGREIEGNEGGTRRDWK